MPSSIAHGLAAAALMTAAYRGDPPRGAAVAAAVCAVVPDLDAVGRPFGWGDVGWLGGHRALTHGLMLAALLAAAVVATWFRGVDLGARRGGRLGLWARLAVATASHGALDALTPYGRGVEFLAPFSDVRVKAPWQPLDALWPEVALVWAPTLAALGLARARRRSRVA